MFGVVLAAVWLALQVQAQTTDVVCASNFAYLNNKQGQSPCLVAAYLQAPCAAEGKNFDVPALQPQSVYNGPQNSNINYCGCSSVVYSMVSACAQCQNHNWIGWSSWRSNCPTSEVTVGQYPLDIPDGTGVPAWAYQNVVQGDSWNKSLALPQVASGAESTYYGTPTASVSYHISTAGDTGIQTGSVATQTASTSTAARKSNVGAIVGGAVGGTVLLALIGVIVWLVIRRRRRTAVDPAVVPSPYYTSPGMGQAGHDQPLPSAVDYGSSYPSASRAHFSDDSGTRNSSSPLRLYDPSDPSTFPRTPEPFGYQSTMMTGSTPSNQHGHSDTTGVGRYRGAAEL